MEESITMKQLLDMLEDAIYQELVVGHNLESYCPIYLKTYTEKIILRTNNAIGIILYDLLIEVDWLKISNSLKSAHNRKS